MSNFTGGSAYSMVQQVADGFILVTERNFKRLSPGELNQLGFEIEKFLRGIRGESPPEEHQELQKRNRRLQRLNSCRMMLQSFRKRWRR